ncbi:MAG: zinc ribbon domain-containing protein, partial [Betaproteobacteria bacterium]|nr:zinc ribbon domain-containing protein [Betaproteobacteria bacterium]
MKETGNNMDCVACGKPISITAKFCGKCGAPVKRAEALADQAPAEQQTPQAVPSPVATQAPPQEVVAHAPATETVDDLVIKLELPEDTDHASML